MSIQIQVRNKVAVNLTPEKVIVCGNSGYELEFLFDEEWASETVKTARFVYRKGGQNYYDEVVFSGNTVNAPVLSGINSVLVGVYAGDLITTTPAVVECDKSILCGSGTHKDPTPDVYNQLVELINKGGATDEKIKSSVTEYLDTHPVSGLSSVAAGLLIEILRNGVFSSDQSANITALAEALVVTEEDPDEPVVPDDPEIPEVTLSSISATYSGGDVPVDTAVTDLTGIVVTAWYSDGSTATVTGYTLSGTIAEGSNTITVSYGGKTTTFTVTGVAESGGEAEGEAVEMESVNHSVCNTMYTDDGATTTKNYTGPTIASTEVFEQDTTVHINFTGGGGYFCIKVGCFDEEAATAYYVFSSGDTVTPYETTYTVKAGYKLIIKTYSAAVLYDTLTVTEVA